MSLQDVRFSNYLVAGCSSIGPTIVTNPLEVWFACDMFEIFVVTYNSCANIILKVIKTRLQLQGELKKLDPNAKVYRGVLHGLYQVGRYDGIKALQKGLAPAFGFQFCLNSIRYLTNDLQINDY